MQIKTWDGIIEVEDDEIVSFDDMNTIISSVTSEDDDGDQYMRLCHESGKWTEKLTAFEFLERCKAWVEADNS